MARPPIRDGALLIGDDGRIQAMGPADSVPAPDGVPTESFGDAVLIPGLINTHTHLELTGFTGPANDTDFPRWIRGIRERKAERSFHDFLDAARQGLRDCHATGVTTVADTGDSGAAVRALSEVAGSGVVFHEVFGPDPDQRDDSLTALQSRWRTLRGEAGARVTVGVSPHAPYTVSGALYEAVARWAACADLPIAVHVAESPAESELLDGGNGAFADAWRERGIAPPAGPGRSPVAWLDAHGVLGPRTLCIHAVRVDRADIERLAATASSVAHCPLSNRAHGHGDAPLRAILDAGVPVGVGTDSVASVGRLDLLAEVRAARSLAGLDALGALALCTTGAARALHLEGAGALAPGQWGDCAVVKLNGEEPDPAERVLAGEPGGIVATFIGGSDVYRAHGAATPALR